MRDEADRSGLPARTEVAVVGGGIAGAAAAYHLAEAGVDVTLLERGTVGGGATSAAVGILSPPLRQPFHETVHFLGEASAAALWRFALRSVASLAQTLHDHGLTDEAGLDLRGGYVLFEPHTVQELGRSFDALRAADLPVHALSGDDVRRLVRGRGFVGGFRIEGLGALRPRATARILARLAGDRGAHVAEDTPVGSIHRGARGLQLETEAGWLEADCVVHATHVEGGTFSSHLDREVVPIRGQGFVTPPLAPRFQGALSTHWKMNVWRQDPSGRILVSGWRHDAWERAYRGREAQVDDHLQGDLQRWFETAFPDLAPLQIERRWSGLFGWTTDFLPLVGRLPGSPGEYAVAGFSGGGLPFAFEAGRLLTHTLLDREPLEGADLFDPARFRKGAHRRDG